MFRRQGRVNLEEASRYLQRLCFHFSRKIPVQYDEREGNAEFLWGHCKLLAQDGVLSFDCQARDLEALGKIQFAIDSHVTLFSRKQPVAVAWSEVLTDNPSPANPG
jgi:hypothetical protein